MESSFNCDELSLDVMKLKSWAEQEEEANFQQNQNHFLGDPVHSSPPFYINNAINSKICLW